MNSFGTRWTFTSFGESHGAAIGGVLDGIPAGLKIDMDMIREALDKRAGRTDTSAGVSPRALNEKDEVEWLSGVMDGVTLGTPIAFIIRNTDARPQDYEWFKTHYRPGHADKTYEEKYGIRDYRGGGRASARETASRVVAGEIARQKLSEQNIFISAHVSQIGEEKDPDKFETLLEEYRAKGDSIGGIVSCEITGIPSGIGEPIFGKLQMELAAAMMSINGCKGFDYGTGFEYTELPGSELYIQPNELTTGGICGGISDGTPIRFRCVFKPAATLGKLYGGRHDACIAIRAVSVVEAMAALAIAECLNQGNYL